MTGVVSQGGSAPTRPIEAGAGTAFRLAQACFLLMVLSLAWMKAPVSIGGLESYPADYLFVVTAALWVAALLRGETAVRWHPAYWLIGLYFAAMAVSATQSAEPQRSAFKLLTQAHLLALPVLTFNLIRTMADLRRVASWWVAAAAAIASLGVATLLLFPFLGADSILSWPLHHFGTLPPGPYPRLELTFTYPAMLVNYFTVAVALVLAGTRLGWFRPRIAWVLTTAILLSSFFALTPGFGGVLFVLGVWFWYSTRDRRPGPARAALLAGCAMPLLGALLAAATPIVHPTAPFLIHMPGLPLTFAPSVRLLAWIEAIHNFLASPIFGRGIGVDAVRVLYWQADQCAGVCVTDAHNTFLNVAVQTGITGLAALLAIIWFVARKLGSPPHSQSGAILFGLGIAWLSGLALQGLVGSFEDARHLWLTLGLIMSASVAARQKAFV